MPPSVGHSGNGHLWRGQPDYSDGPPASFGKENPASGAGPPVSPDVQRFQRLLLGGPVNGGPRASRSDRNASPGILRTRWEPPASAAKPTEDLGGTLVGALSQGADRARLTALRQQLQTVERTNLFSLQQELKDLYDAQLLARNKPLERARIERDLIRVQNMVSAHEAIQQVISLFPADGPLTHDIKALAVGAAVVSPNSEQSKSVDRTLVSLARKNPDMAQPIEKLRISLLHNNLSRSLALTQHILRGYEPGSERHNQLDERRRRLETAVSKLHYTNMFDGTTLEEAKQILRQTLRAMDQEE